MLICYVFGRMFPIFSFISHQMFLSRFEQFINSPLLLVRDPVPVLCPSSVRPGNISGLSPLSFAMCCIISSISVPRPILWFPLDHLVPLTCAIDLVLVLVKVWVSVLYVKTRNTHWINSVRPSLIGIFNVVYFSVIHLS